MNDLKISLIPQERNTYSYGRAFGEISSNGIYNWNIDTYDDARKILQDPYFRNLSHPVRFGTMTPTSNFVVKQTPNGWCAIEDIFDEGKIKSQELQNLDRCQIKINTVTTPEKELKTVHYLDKDGFYSVTRTKDGKIIGGYEGQPIQRKLMTGFKGKVEKLGMAIATDANGCERPILRRVGGFILNLSKRIK